MYKIRTKEIEIEGEKKLMFGVECENGVCYDFSTDADEAKRLAIFLNENEVEFCHVTEVIEDLFYS